MDQIELIRSLAKETESKIVFLVMDGLGGHSMQPGGPTELEAANTPNLDKLAAASICGMVDPIAPGITPGSGPGHLGLFGFDPIDSLVGRGVLESMGIAFALELGDVAVRVNFCTMDENGLVTDRRAGRISTELNEKLCAKLDTIELPGVEVFVRPVKEHRAAIVLKGEGLGGPLNDTDPQVTGKPAVALAHHDPATRKTAELLDSFVQQAKVILKDEHPANMILLRGIDCYHPLPTMHEVYKLKAAAVAQYPMYKGLARLIGMDILEVGPDLGDLAGTLEKHYDDYTYFFVHVKKTDSYGEDGNFEAKVKIIEQTDSLVLPRILALDPDVLAVTADHSTPALLKSHSWHTVPAMIHSRYCRPDQVTEFSERACVSGGFNRLPGKCLMAEAMAQALKLDKFGA